MLAVSCGASAFYAGCAEGVTDFVPDAGSAGPPVPRVVDAEAARPDAEARDGSAGDANAPDGNAPDGNAPDGSVLDAGGLDAAAVDASPPPVIDGVVGAGEYGLHVNGQNQQVSSSPGNTWFMTWNDTSLFVAVTAANIDEGVVLYLDQAPLLPGNGGVNADGSITGVAYDTTKIAVPFRADFVAYVKSSYQEHRSADGANGWSLPITTGLVVQGKGDVREIAIPWAMIPAARRPSSFSWLGYVTSASGFVYGQMPTDNAGGNVGLGASYGAFYKVANTTPGAGTKPFETKLSL